MIAAPSGWKFLAPALRAGGFFYGLNPGLMPGAKFCRHFRGSLSQMFWDRIDVNDVTRIDMSAEAVKARIKLACRLGDRLQLWRLAREAAFRQKQAKRAIKEEAELKEDRSRIDLG